MSRVTELEKALTTLFRKGTEVGYTETEIDEFLENIDYHALLQAVWNKAETVYAYIACGYTDLRKGIDGLARLVQQQFELDPFTNTLFLFCGRRRDRIKGLYWEKDGFILLYKRLEQGAYQWPRSESEVKTLTPQQYRWLMEGLQIEQPKAHRPVTGLSAV